MDRGAAVAADVVREAGSNVTLEHQLQTLTSPELTPPSVEYMNSLDPKCSHPTLVKINTYKPTSISTLI